MNATDLRNVCRICPNGRAELYNIFDEKFDLTYNLKEVILVTTGVEIMTNDLISTKICKKCCNITLKMFQFRQDACKQDQALKEMLNRHLENKGLKLPNTCITIKKEKVTATPLTATNIDQCPPSTSKEQAPKKILHPSIADLYKKYPGLKLNTRCLEKDMSPFISLPMGDVESYFKSRQLDIKKYVYRPRVKCLSNAVAKKRTSVPTKPKTVAPLKISLKMLANIHPPDGMPSNNYVCTPLPKKRGRKRKIPLTENDQCSKPKVINRNIKLVSESPTMVKEITTTQQIDSTLGATEPAAVTMSESELPTSSQQIDSALGATEPAAVTMSESELPTSSQQIDSTLGATEPTEETMSKPVRPTTSQINPSIDRTNPNKTSYIAETTSKTGANKPEFIESLGLTPIYTTKSQKCLVCNVCGSVHNSGIDLKWHSRKHMVCQFCKRKCKSIDAKQNHVDKFCKVKRIMNLPGPTVALEKIHLNLDVRKKYMEAFSSLDPIPGLIEPAPLERVLLEAASPPPDVSDDGIIVLSDDESLAESSDPLSGISPSLSGMPPPAVERAMYNSAVQLKPDIKIKNNTIFNHLASRTSDKEMIKDLIKIIRPEQPTTCDQILQTNLPDNKLIKMKNLKGTCELKNLREQLMFYKIPIKVSNGVFNVSYNFIEESGPNKRMELWDDLPVNNDYKRRIPESTNTSCKGNQVRHQNGSVARSRKASNKDVSSAQINATIDPCVSSPSTAPIALANTLCDSISVNDQISRPSISCPNIPVSSRAPNTEPEVAINSKVAFASPVSLSAPGSLFTKSVIPTNLSEVSKIGERQKESNAECHPKLLALNKMNPSNKMDVLDLTVKSIPRATSAPVTIPTATLSNTLYDRGIQGNPNRNKVLSPPNVISHNTLSNGRMPVVSSQVNSTHIATNSSFPATIPTATSMSAHLPSFSTIVPPKKLLPANSIALTGARPSASNSVAQVTTNQGINRPDPSYIAPLLACSSNSVVNESVFQATNNYVLNGPRDSNSYVRENLSGINKSLSIPKSYNNIVLSKNTAADRSLTANNSNMPCPTYTDANVGSGSSYANISNTNTSVLGYHIVRPGSSVVQPSNNTSVINGSFPTTNRDGGVLPPATHISISTNLIPKEPVKFRVKKVWELQ